MARTAGEHRRDAERPHRGHLELGVHRAHTAGEAAAHVGHLGEDPLQALHVAPPVAPRHSHVFAHRDRDRSAGAGDRVGGGTGGDDIVYAELC